MDSFHARSHRTKSPKPAHEDSARAGVRIDQLMVERGLAVSRSAAQRLIAEGKVSWNAGQGEQQMTHRVTKASEVPPVDAEIRIVSE